MAQETAISEQWPNWGVEHTTTRLDLPALFGRDAPCVLEIGFGNGDALIHDSTAAPEKNFLGIEVHRPGVGRLLMHIEQLALSNVRVSCHDAVEVLQDQLPPESLDAVNIFFPDPWPKKKHHKRRLIQPTFLSLLAQSMKPAGRLHVATDWQPYAEHIHECLTASEDFVHMTANGSLDDAKNIETQTEAQTGKQLRTETRFERRGRKLGHDVWDFIYQKQP